MKLVSVALLSLALFCVAGCGGGTEGGQPVYSVTGTVMMNGTILPEATVVFSPLGEQPTATGMTDAQGNFTLTTYEFGDGAAAGSYKVLVTKTMVMATGGASDGLDDEGHEEAEENAASHDKKGAAPDANLVPEKYSSPENSTLDAEVKASGDNTFTFEITP